MTVAVSLHPLLDVLRVDFPYYTFTAGNEFAWRPDDQTIIYAPHEPSAAQQLLHELAHAELLHTVYELDVELLEREAWAWQYAERLAKQYHLTLPRSVAEDHLDTYRLWLWKRSQCPECHQTGIQTTKNTYSCINCRYSWRVNEARKCNLKRYRLD